MLEGAIICYMEILSRIKLILDLDNLSFSSHLSKVKKQKIKNIKYLIILTAI